MSKAFLNSMKVTAFRLYSLIPSMILLKARIWLVVVLPNGDTIFDVYWEKLKMAESNPSAKSLDEWHNEVWQDILKCFPLEYRQVPARCIRQNTRTFLDRRLTPEQPLGRDFREFAAFLDCFTANDMMYYQDKRCTEPFLGVFDHWCKDDPSRTIDHLLIALYQIKRIDILMSEEFRKLAGIMPCLQAFSKMFHDFVAVHRG